MDRTPVTSSGIKSIGHDPDTNTLEIEFSTGTVHQYQDVPAEEHQRLMQASSIGAHFHKHIRSQYHSKAL